MPFIVPHWAIIYIWGAIGSLGVEVVAAAKACADLGGEIPPPYKKWFYIVTRVALIFAAAGPLAVAFQAANEWSAVYMGAGAPIIFDRLQRGLPAQQ